jgi:hypothetical protein
MSKMIAATVVFVVYFLTCPFGLLGSSGVRETSGGKQGKHMTADQVIKTYLNAVGGETRLRGMSSKTMRYRVYMVQHGGYLVEQTIRRPGILKAKRSGSDQYTLFDGEKAWLVMGEKREELKGPVVAQFKRRADLDGPFLGSEDKGIRIEYVGKERFELSHLHHLKATFPGGEEKDYYFTDDTGLLAIVKQPSFRLVNNKVTQGPRTINHYYDYREVDGIKFPFLWVQTNEKLEQMHVFVVESIQLNIPCPGEK